MEPKTEIPDSTGQGKPGDPANADKTIAAMLGEVFW